MKHYKSRSSDDDMHTASFYVPNTISIASIQSYTFMYIPQRSMKMILFLLTKSEEKHFPYVYTKNGTWYNNLRR